ncbi:glycosyltransferase family 4 protein [Sphingomonas sp. MG17]|uniref:Glycosyltransferase family 4 protein n=1 Tax=Sphingomonas tagetis TaxID=2949092 RepID=A0A9X2HMK2_9SPHN|nr:glycosyltransferase family 4 protein [Sphingomonas tagetis]MCP3732902.1 glycosyltransferase family 4 protein [Sphingomonas tagetis]
MKCAIITNIPVPYRNPIWSRLPRGDYVAIFCARTEGNREWRLPPPNFDHVFLAENIRDLPDGYNFVHNNPDVWRVLNRIKPEVVVTTGLNPTHLYAIIWAKMHKAAHVYMTDGTELSEQNMGWKHRLLRRLVIRGASAGVAASLSGKRLLEGYGLARDRIFLSRLCADNAKFSPLPLSERPYDVLFCGQLHERKLPYFFVETCAEIRRRRGTCRALVLGNGPEREAVLNALRDAGIEITAPGFIQPDQLANWYPKARLLLFPTRLDPWGVVANEAMASGTPVVTTPAAGVAADLVIDYVNGRILPDEVQAWATACVELLDNPSRWQTLSTQAFHDVQAFNYADAAAGLEAACERAVLEAGR